jgi:hypothetical protein
MREVLDVNLSFTAEIDGAAAMDEDTVCGGAGLRSATDELRVANLIALRCANGGDERGF